MSEEELEKWIHRYFTGDYRWPVEALPEELGGVNAAYMSFSGSEVNLGSGWVYVSAMQKADACLRILRENNIPVHGVTVKILNINPADHGITDEELNTTSYSWGDNYKNIRYFKALGDIGEDEIYANTIARFDASTAHSVENGTRREPKLQNVEILVHVDPIQLQRAFADKGITIMDAPEVETFKAMGEELWAAIKAGGGSLDPFLDVVDQAKAISPSDSMTDAEAEKLAQILKSIFGPS